MPPRNVVVAQSGGPTCVINNSLRGIIEACRSHPSAFGKVYGGRFGIEGVLKEELIDLSATSAEEIALLRTSPAAGSIGTCRYKLKKGQDQDFERVVDVFKAHDVGTFFYIGGNDSQDTAHKVSVLARDSGLDLVAVGVPKTIDNDLGDAEFRLLDHSPGYGSVARYYAHYVRQANEENAGSCPADPVLVIQAMGRKIGFIPAAARLADPERKMPIQIYLTESGLTLEQLGENVIRQLESDGRCIVVVSEGFDVGDVGAIRDNFGHIQFGASQQSVAQIVVNYLNTLKFPVPGKARGQVPGTDQRNAIAYASVTDLDEAYGVGRHAVEVARKHGNGWMSTILRDRTGSGYNVHYDKAPLEQVANSERFFPKSWIAPSRIDVTDDFVEYARPLIGEDWVSVPTVAGLPRFARIAPVFAPKKLPAYIPQTARAKE
ncbi:MAG: diphosphate--fructose-6-phosphate 1-phosphotransferase [Paludisphaera borealis]|uniref:diphosphate--fructose-6-phosphate 1-phosphotransferase n=1 Tax=Paludisphaera borealis TaxID=1387353 RepID=UPI00284C364B|nr:diphosphate--fructose-6-phosphate 1-phosphotransferase [Paludisphaera borealis]MDR3618102.1 diphosphate--fructose-6-phosphate 1-phosphotransferase [Paludisphaera borealis]